MVSNNQGLVARGELSYVWSRESGRRIIVIIDDEFYHVHGPKPYPATLASTQGLYATFLHSRDEDDTRAVGFFMLPHSVEYIDTQLIPDISGWLSEVRNGETQVYFLIDVFYGPEDEGIEMGPAVFKRLQSIFTEEKFAFLSQAGWSPLDEPSGPLIRPQVFAKGTIETQSKLKHKLPEDFLKWLNVTQDQPRASEIDLDTWKRLRKSALAICKELGYKSGQKYWAHHLPYGGDFSGDKFEKIQTWTGDLKRALLQIASEIEEFPDYGWEHDTIDAIQGWEQPPVRALAQFTPEAKDLSAAIYLLKKDVRRNTQDTQDQKVKVRFASSLTMRPFDLKHDYLWFNISAVGRGLFLLAESLKGEINKVLKGTKKLDELPVKCTGGRIFWRMTELDKDEKLGLQIEVEQYLIGWSVSSDMIWKNYPCFMRCKYPLPDPGKATGVVKDAYDYIKRSGARLITNDGTLTIDIEAKVISDEDNSNHTYWEVMG